MRKLDQSLPLRLLKAREAVMECFRPHLKANGLTEQQWRVLRALAEVEEIDIGALSEWIALLMPSLSRILPGLEKAGLITRRRAPRDGRVVILSLTPAGRALFETMSRESERIYLEMERRLGSFAIGEIMRELDRLIRALDAAKDTRVLPAGMQDGKGQ